MIDIILILGRKRVRVLKIIILKLGQMKSTTVVRLGIVVPVGLGLEDVAPSIPMQRCWRENEFKRWGDPRQVVFLFGNGRA